MLYPGSPSSTERLFNLSVREVWGTLQQIFLFILIFVAVKSVYTHLPVWSMPLEILLGLVVTAVTIFLFVMALLRTDARFRGVLLTIQQTVAKAVQSILRIYLACLLLAVAFILVFWFGRWLVFSVMGFTAAIAGMGMMVFVGVPMILLLIYFYLTIPLLVLYEQSLVKVFFFSVQYAQRRFLAVIILYGEIVIMLLISSPHTRHSQWLLNHHLMELCDLVVFCAMLPLLINLTVLILHDVKLKINLELQK